VYDYSLCLQIQILFSVSLASFGKSVPVFRPDNSHAAQVPNQ